MAVWIALTAVFIALIPALLIARAKANARDERKGDGGYVASDGGGGHRSKDNDESNNSSGDGDGDGGGNGGGGGD